MNSFCVAWVSWHRGQQYIWSVGDGSTTLVDEMGGCGIPGGNGLGNLLLTSLFPTMDASARVSGDLLSL